jgi:hypothetical protein
MSEHFDLNEEFGFLPDTVDGFRILRDQMLIESLEMGIEEKLSRLQRMRSGWGIEIQDKSHDFQGFRDFDIAVNKL